MCLRVWLFILRILDIDFMEKIFKYPIDITDKQSFSMPVGAKILTVQVQNGNPFIWAMVDPEAPTEEVTIRVHGTGHPIYDSSNLEYISTFQSMYGVNLVFHVFKEIADTGCEDYVLSNGCNCDCPIFRAGKCKIDDPEAAIIMLDEDTELDPEDREAIYKLYPQLSEYKNLNK